jgi:hypothetical protein
MDSSEPAPRRRSIAIVAAAGLACLAVALPVSGAFAEGDGGSTPHGQADPYGQPPAGTPGERGDGGPQDGRNRPDCPKDGAGDGQGQGSDSSAPAPSGDAVQL